ncbi:hypothetical protein HN51_035873 [Arachis hypogaea]|nr:uncharacterized protein LOC107630328 [Arachis ipaensis]XP_025644249.1 uncharacterized protein LOC112738148 [Arachis hypogaea]QHO01097.1 uncharacterized protein DS421_13g412070 [Arachis hypogaea]RYR20676.1 hypothetical protein Ahy_B03g065886 isoform B [Arachis hypogaea]
MMNSCRYQQSYEDMTMGMGGSLLCPKPRRLPLFTCPSPTSYHSPARADLLDIILPKGGCYPERTGDLVEVAAASPPFFCGSPPSRASNPVIQDEQFGNNGNFSPFTMPSSSPSSSSAPRSCGPMKFGHAPAAVRIVGFESLSRDRSNCSISAVA